MYPSLHKSGISKLYKRKWLLIFLCNIMLFSSKPFVWAQGTTTYHLNKGNGLPSNHVYSFLQDKLGYLWIATDQGVVKYNGYTTQLFNKIEGLPTDDIWAMIDDNSGRLWVGGGSGQFGYIYNNKYQNAALHNISGTIFPYYLHRFDSGIIFTTPYISGNRFPSICISRHDTIFPYTVTDAMISPNDTIGNYLALQINEQREAYASLSDCNYLLTNLQSIADSPASITIQKKGETRKFRFHEYSRGSKRFLCNKSIVMYTPGQYNDFIIFDASTIEADTIQLRKFGINGTIRLITFYNDRSCNNLLFVFTNDECTIFDISGKIRYVSTVNLTHKNTQKLGNIIQYLPLALWDTIIATSNSGVFFLPASNSKEFEHQSNTELSGYECLGTLFDSITYWWHPQQARIKFFSHQRQLYSYQLNGYTVNDVVQYSKDSLLFLGSFSHFFTLKDQKFHKIRLGQFGAALKCIYEYKPKCYYLLCNTGVYNIRPDYNLDSLRRIFIDIDRFDNGVPDRYRQQMIVWHNSKLLIFDEKKKIAVAAKQITHSSDALLEKVCTEPTYGNIFIKTSNELLFFDPDTHKTTEIKSNVNLKNSTIDVWKNYLIVLGEFGVTFHRIEGKEKVSGPITYLNVKKRFYKEIQSHAVAAGVVTLQTDAGVYTVKVPEPAAFALQNNYTIPYRIILRDNHERVLNNGDTVRLANDARILYADVINPLGNGTVRIYYRFGGATDWTKCNGNEIVRPNYITPDNFYRIEIYCEDDGWRSDITTATVWVQPTWWQKRSTKYLLWFGGVLLIIVVVSVSVAVTNRLVLRSQQKRQMQMELELKAIYAQINPHFIFNALTSAMLLIKKNRTEEAYTHVAKFSRLLRSYLNSSRNKYITIADEIANLTNYMELQQTRFKDRFESIISVEDTLDPNNLIPSLLIQPFVENAINHGVLPSEHTGRVEVTFRSIKEGIQCTVSDNGVGRQASRKAHGDRDPTHGSFGNLMIKDLIKIFDKYEEMKINISYRDRELPNVGTDVIIDIIYVQPNIIPNSKER